ncbi:hypothetical protein [Falsiroseomonas sp. E2-1-a20]|uniref:hypothetical protein n=1 Tax=Falsiroseomonas sp. E2-1-a20 TaxID=3239300 RepID=UPI003F2AAF39
MKRPLPGLPQATLTAPSATGSTSIAYTQNSGVPALVRQVRRRNWSTEERLRIVRETLAPGVLNQSRHAFNAI